MRLSRKPRRITCKAVEAEFLAIVGRLSADPDVRRLQEYGSAALSENPDLPAVGQCIHALAGEYVPEFNTSGR